jgi:hypothetical protein
MADISRFMFGKTHNKESVCLSSVLKIQFCYRLLSMFAFFFPYKEKKNINMVNVVIQNNNNRPRFFSNLISCEK